ncbi:sigma factor-like helix-turn-helix DNA-binding protein [Bacillota bacterium Meth-B3]
MRIQYKDADGRVLELEVSEEVGRFYLADMDRERKSDRRETRRHTPLSAFNYEDHAYFDSGIDICGQLARADAVKRAMDKLTPRERYLLTAVHIDNRSYSEIARAERKAPSTVLRETRKAAERFRHFFGPRE